MNVTKSGKSAFREEILQILKEYGKWMHARDITGIMEHTSWLTVKSALQQLKKEGKVKQPGRGRWEAV